MRVLVRDAQRFIPYSYYMLNVDVCIDFVQSHMILRNSNICWNEADEQDVKSHHSVFEFGITLQCEMRSIDSRHTQTRWRNSHIRLVFMDFVSSSYSYPCLCLSCSYLAFRLPHKFHLPFSSTHEKKVDRVECLKRMQYGVNEI